jgi:hypothetical protein
MNVDFNPSKNDEALFDKLNQESQKNLITPTSTVTPEQTK